MKISIKIILVGLVLLCTNLTKSNAQNIGVLDYKVILYNLPQTKKVDTTLMALKIQYYVLLDRKKEDLQRKYKSYDSSFNVLSIDSKSQKTQVINNLKTELEKLQLKADSTIQAKTNELMFPIYQNFNKAIKEIAKKRKMTQVWDISTNGLLYRDEAIDITNDLKQYYHLK